MATGVIVWSQTAASNATADSGVNWAEGMAPSAVNDSARAMMAANAKWRDDLNATLMASGVSTALTLATNQVQGALTAGYQASFTTTFDVGSPATINVDTLGPKPLRRGPATAILPSQIKTGQPVKITYFTSNSGEWITDGTRGIVLASQVITTTATTYTPASGMAYCIVEAVGGGAGGGGTTGNAGAVRGGGGGGAGSWTRAVISATQVTSSQIVTIGAAGTATAGTSGGDGGNTSLGSLVTAIGGKGGAKGTSSPAAGGAGGTAGTGDVSVAGQPGGTGCDMPMGGMGGSNPRGFGGQIPDLSAAATAGIAGTGYGSGGSGAVSNNSASTLAGGAGTAGIVIITEFI